jgi:hypothetical protein
MELSSYVEQLRQELLIAAEAGGDEARALAERLTAPLDSATRLVLLEALSAAADEISRDLAPGSVDVRLQGRNPRFVVTPPPSEEADDTAEVPPGGVTVSAMDRGPLLPPSAVDAEEGGSARINLRLPESLKVRAEQAAAREGLSLNAWLVRAVAAVVEPDRPDTESRPRGSRGRQRYTGWVR